MNTSKEGFWSGIEDVPEVDEYGAISWIAPIIPSLSGIQPVLPEVESMELDSIERHERKKETQSKHHENKLRDDDGEEEEEDGAIP
ncbi:hypothetical protein SUGI_0071630 [Cryptomeria japonica]|nr:hypothetical protein SUGI_0071630 [Cryptomeria japonica]